MSKTIPIVLLCAAILAGGGWYYYQQEQQAAPQQDTRQASSSVSVSVQEIKKQKIKLEDELPGRVTAYRQSKVRPQVAGIITDRLFEEGADVEKGQQLYQIDDASYRASLNSALADLKSAEAKAKSAKSLAKRYAGLVKIDAVSEQEYDDAQASLDQANAAIAVAKASVDMAQVSLNYTKVYAPISGRIGRSLVTEGALVTANQTDDLAVITQLNPIYVDMQVSGPDVVRLRRYLSEKKSLPVHLMTGEKGKNYYEHDGNLQLSEVTVDETTGAITVRALFPNDDEVLLPGLFVRAVVELGEDDVILVPQRATTRQADGSLVAWVVDAEGKAQPRTIDVVQSYKNQWVVTSGLDVGDKVIVEGYQKVAQGAAVSATPWQDPTDATQSAPAAGSDAKE